MCIVHNKYIKHILHYTLCICIIIILNCKQYIHYTEHCTQFMHYTVHKIHFTVLSTVITLQSTQYIIFKKIIIFLIFIATHFLQIFPFTPFSFSISSQCCPPPHCHFISFSDLSLFLLKWPRKSAISKNAQIRSFANEQDPDQFVLINWTQID